jgi:hypothetical protein
MFCCPSMTQGLMDERQIPASDALAARSWAGQPGPRPAPRCHGAHAAGARSCQRAIFRHDNSAGSAPPGRAVRQVLGAIAQFEKASLVAKLKAARDRKIAQGIKCGGRKSYAERSPELVAAAKALQAERPRLSLRKIARRLAEQGYTLKGRPYAAMSVRGMLRG